MRIFAYAAEVYAEAARQAVGYQPLTCPPLDCNGFNPRWLEKQDILFFLLHGMKASPVWMGEASQKMGPISLLSPALRVEQLTGLNLEGSVIFAGNCYMGDKDDVFRQAFFKAGASAIVAGKGINYTNKTGSSYGVSLLAKWFIRYYRAIRNPRIALILAKVMLVGGWHLSPEIRQANQDVLQFELHSPGKAHDIIKR